MEKFSCRSLRYFSDISRCCVKPKESKIQLASTYNPEHVESEWYQWWEKSGHFKPREEKGNGQVYSMILPPPNVTGTLHLGHALTITIQDTLARWHRMCGRNVVWVPGTDHAGIATQAVVERTLKQSMGKTRDELGRERFLEEIWRWKQMKGGRITDQLKKLGASLDWNREFFTMDSNQSEAVAKAFITLWEAGLIYREETLVNWSCLLRSVISDIEVDHMDISGPTPVSIQGYPKPVTFGRLVDFAYKLADKDEEIVVSTTRVETMLGDVAVAVHPEDPKYKDKIGAQLRHPFTNRTIPVIEDVRVDPNLGTGAVKITPAHNQLDFDIAKTHNLPVDSIITESGTMAVPLCKHFLGMHRFKAREALTEALGGLGLLRGIKSHPMQVPICSRSGDVVELLLKPQWFLKCKDMAKRASDDLKAGALIIEPDQFHKNWFHWLDNMRDWCISRQLWWGHQLPLYHCENESNSVYVGALSEAEAKEKAMKTLSGEIKVRRETDVLDTWFSSALLPFTSFGWPDKKNDMDKFYPLSLMVTGHDILFFWVARMVMLGTQLTGKIPFKKVSLHGIVCDTQGRKMSKSLGNVVDPEDIIKGASLETLKDQVTKNCSDGILSSTEAEIAKIGLEELFPKGIPQCGTDALRYTLLSHRVKSHYINFNVNECYSNKLFCNKIWQACRFALDWEKALSLSLSDFSALPKPDDELDKWILSELATAINTTNTAMEAGEFHLATSALRDFLYNDFCDVYLEYAKPILKKNTNDKAWNTCYILLFCLDSAVKALAPFMPYLAEELYNFMPGKKLASVLYEKYPRDYQWENLSLKENINFGLEIITAVRKLKLDNNMKVKDTPRVWVLTEKKGVRDLFPAIVTLAGCKDVTLCQSLHSRKLISSTKISFDTEICISLKACSPPKVKVNKKETLMKKRKLEKELDKIIKMRANDGYRKVPVHIREAHSEKILRLKSEIATLCE